MSRSGEREVDDVQVEREAAVRPRLSSDVRRRATVFPLGLYAACSFAVRQITGITGIGVFTRVWTWLAVIVFVFAGLIRRSWRVLRK